MVPQIPGLRVWLFDAVGALWRIHRLRGWRPRARVEPPHVFEPTPTVSPSNAVAEMTMTRRALNRATLARQMLLRREAVSPVRAVERLAGLQAQVPRPPFVGLWSRVEGFRREDLGRAIERQQIVRGTLMRGTLHLVSRKDYVRFRRTLQPMLTAGLRSILRDTDSGSGRRRRRRRRPPVVRRGAADVRRAPDAPRAALSGFGRARARLCGADGTAASAGAGRRRAVGVSCPGRALRLPSRGSGERSCASRCRRVARLAVSRGVRPASVADAQTWCGLAGLAAVFERLRPKLRTFRDERGRELFDLPTLLGRTPEPRRPSASCPSGTTCCSRTPIGPA